jgi:hypothetical protein
MPSNLAQSPEDERHWAEAKRQVEREYPNASGDRKWRLTTAIFERMKHRLGGGSKARKAVTDPYATQGHAKTPLEQPLPPRYQKRVHYRPRPSATYTEGEKSLFLARDRCMPVSKSNGENANIITMKHPTYLAVSKARAPIGDIQPLRVLDFTQLSRAEWDLLDERIRDWLPNTGLSGIYEGPSTHWHLCAVCGLLPHQGPRSACRDLNAFKEERLFDSRGHQTLIVKVKVEEVPQEAQEAISRYEAFEYPENYKGPRSPLGSDLNVSDVFPESAKSRRSDALEGMARKSYRAEDELVQKAQKSGLWQRLVNFLRRRHGAICKACNATGEIKVQWKDANGKTFHGLRQCPDCQKRKQILGGAEVGIREFIGKSRSFSDTEGGIRDFLKSKKPRLGSGERFKEIAEHAAKEYGNEEAGKRVAAAIGRRKYGKKKMQAMALTGKRRQKRKAHKSEQEMAGTAPSGGDVG